MEGGAVWYRFTDDSEERTTFIFRVKSKPSKKQTASREHVPPKRRWTSSALHSVTSQMAVLLTIMAAENLRSNSISHLNFHAFLTQ
jgi:hypothetical protein